MMVRSFFAESVRAAVVALAIVGCRPDTTTAPNRLRPKSANSDVAKLTTTPALYSQTSSNPNLSSITIAGITILSADDFVVPNGEVWTVTQVSLTGSLITSALPFSIRANTRAGVPGDPLPNAVYGIGPTATDPNACDCSFLGRTVTDYLFPLPAPLILTSGTYWLTVHNSKLDNGLPTFFWQQHFPIVGSNERSLGVFAPDQWAGASHDAAFVIFGTLMHTQTISFSSITPNPAPIGSSAALQATATSGLAVSFSSLTPNVCAVDGTSVSFTKLGTCTVAADQAGSDAFVAAPQAVQSAIVAKIAQTIAFKSAAPAPAYINGSYAASPLGGGSGNPVLMTAEPSSVCTLSNNTVRLIGVGVCTLTANQAGDDRYDAAQPATQIVKVDYRFDGFREPVSNRAVNSVNAGQAVALKWRLADANGVPITTVTTSRIAVEQHECVTGVVIGAATVQSIAAPTLQNLGGGSYQYDWKTPAGYARSCRSVLLDLGEGSGPRVAHFSFTK